MSCMLSHYGPRWLKLISGLVIFTLGALMLAAPEMLI